MKILLRIYDYDLPNIYYKPRKANGWGASAEKPQGQWRANVWEGHPERTPITTVASAEL